MGKLLAGLQTLLCKAGAAVPDGWPGQTWRKAAKSGGMAGMAGLGNTANHPSPRVPAAQPGFQTIVLCMALLLPAVLAACGSNRRPGEGMTMAPPPADGGHAGASPEIRALEDAGGIPLLERGDSLSGTDADGNGIRDDVDAYILEHYGHEPEQLAAVQQFARAMQAAVVFSSDDREEARKVAHQSSRAIDCVFDKLKGTERYRATREVAAITAMTANTKPRLVSYLTYSKMLGGMVFTLPRGDTCE